ncbi:hypothetical protein CHS0354_034874 [Potamilus streckersoni]|uniref:DDB1- and CUL4-associated factor 15 WD40 repeat-containing domain-containing protein n=1 Tax=Potamilus streckersoni TaxID=2493646 RepID=A0AAE0S7I4_9BIVA|nr:hypothetical protein CHS0354_034874 [Potamilus streckersoni]
MARYGMSMTANRYGWKSGRGLMRGPETSENSNSEKTLCLRHGFCVHTKYVLTPPFPVFCPRVQLKFDGSIIINTGDSIIALSVQLSTRKKCDLQGQKADAGLRETRQNSTDDKHREKSENGAISGSYNTCNVQDSLIHLNTHARVEVNEKSLQLSLSQCSDSEDQKENESIHSPEVRLDKCKSPKSPPEVKFEKIKSPKSPKCVLFPSQKSPTNPLPHDNWFECLGFGSSSNQNSSSSLRKMHPGCSGINVHPVAKDLYNFDSDDSEDSSSNLRYSISGIGRYSLRSRQVGSTQDLVSHAQNIIIAQASIGSREKMLQNSGKFSPLHSSQALNFDIGRPSLTVDVCIHPRALASSQRSFFSPSNSENGSSCGNSPVVESPMFVSNEPKTITFSCRKYSFKEGEQESESPLGSEDDLAYGGVLPMEARGPHERLLSLQTTDNNDDDTKQDKVNIKQWTFDVEIYMENAIKKTAEWGHRYVDFINYDLQVLDVCSDRGFVLGQVYTLVHAREDISQIKKARRSRLLVKLYQTSFTFEWNIGTDDYETLHIDSLIEIDERDARKKDWKPGFKECTILRRQTCVPQSVFKTVHVLSNESVFKGRSLQTLLSVQHYTAILL